MSTTKTETACFATDPRAAMRAFIGGYPWGRMSDMPELDAPIEAIDESGLFAGLETREAYLAWVADYKRLVNEAADHIRSQKALRKSRDEAVQYRSQEEADYIGRCVTVAIHMRRLGKRWSAARRAAEQSAAA